MKPVRETNSLEHTATYAGSLDGGARGQNKMHASSKRKIKRIVVKKKLAGSETQTGIVGGKELLKQSDIALA